MTVFRPRFQTIGHVDFLPIAADIRPEPILHQCDVDYAYINGGDITQAFINALPDNLFPQGNDGWHLLIDQRIHELRRGHYPAIPGWHLDWTPRIENGTKPDFDNIPNYNQALLIIAMSSLTEFIRDEFYLPSEVETFEEADALLNGLTGGIQPSTGTFSVKNGDITTFTSYDWHRAVPSTEDKEWRLMLRASKVHRRPVNDIRGTAQVYIPVPEYVGV